LGELQWDALLPRLQARIVLEHENQEAIDRLKVMNLPCCKIDNLFERF
jgi:hypothetical protein